MKKNIEGSEAHTTDSSLAKKVMTSKGNNPVIQLDELKRTLSKRTPLDPTRYGDWEKKGRCIDF
ncbi:MAG: Unknown protein [uncultured Thiotrichaceae bacterium]|uniref:DUF1674 domain-containing protein n=1 Tax=uncultured Thiotrichaceae bacterium TaxID=298394 RepID=A0A6S6T5J3_9GAMM|nr:MAG: Unknown protein [uncultured Thiotrichaceae bacterium]